MDNETCFEAIQKPLGELADAPKQQIATEVGNQETASFSGQYCLIVADCRASGGGCVAYKDAYGITTIKTSEFIEIINVDDYHFKVLNKSSAGSVRVKTIETV